MLGLVMFANFNHLSEVLSWGLISAGKAVDGAKPKTIIAHNDSDVPPGLIAGKWTEEELKEWYFDKVFKLNNNNLNKTARALNVNPTTLLRRRGRNK